MVLKRKLPTQEAKKDKVVEQENQFDDFDMSIEAEEKAKPAKVDKGHDMDDDFPAELADKPEDFIPEELRALEEANPVEAEPVIEKAEKVMENKELKQEQETQDIAPVSFDEPVKAQEPEDEFKIEEPVFEKTEPVEDDFPTPFEKTDVAPAELPTSQEVPVDSSFASFDEPVTEEIKEEDSMKKEDTIEQAPLEPIDFETPEPVNWNEVSNEKAEVSTDSFETVSWENDSTVEVKQELKDDRFETVDVKDEDPIFGSSNNNGIVPEIQGFEDDFSTPAEVIGQNSKDMNMNSEAKKKLFTGVAAVALAIGGLVVYSNMDKTTEVANRWTGSLTEATQDIAETPEEEQQLIDDGVDITQTEEVIDFADMSSGESEVETTDSTTEINMLEPEVIETTSSGKEIIKATGEEEMPEDVEEGVNLITDLTAEIERQKAARRGLTEEESAAEENPNTDEGNAADINKKVDEQLAEYRKLLAEEEDPGKKVKPGAFFSGSFEEGATPRASNVSKVQLNSEGEAVMPVEYQQNGVTAEVKGHQIIEYPQGTARKPDDGIRQLDHFRTLLVEKEDERVRIPKGVSPMMRNQGFPKFKVISIVPNYGLIGEYNGKKGILMIGDTFKGWELVGVYESYAEFKSDSRKHIISLK